MQLKLFRDGLKKTDGKGWLESWSYKDVKCLQRRYKNLLGDMLSGIIYWLYRKKCI